MLHHSFNTKIHTHQYQTKLTCTLSMYRIMPNFCIWNERWGENNRTKGKNLCQSTPITVQQCPVAKHCIGRASFKNQCGECIRLSWEVSYYIVLPLSGEKRLSNTILTNIHLLSCWHYDVITFRRGHDKATLNDCFHWPGRSSGLQQNISELLTLDPSSSEQ